MEKHPCNLCFRSFANGRALGGHMRSHVAASTKAAAQLIKDASSSSPSESSSSRDEDDDKMMMMMGPLGYGLRENPKKSFRLVDPEFSSTFPAVEASSAAIAVAAATAAGSSVVVQDRESETESSRAPATTHRRRSKRARRAAAAAAAVVSQPDPLPLAEPEPLSSVSDTTPEEDVAISLMMLSRDVWAPMTKSEEQQQQQSEQRFTIVDEENENEIEVEAYRASNRIHDHHQHPVKGRSKYQCGTCKKVFRSYQALGGHRASHKKTNGCVPPPSPVAQPQFQIQYEGRESSEANVERVQHECPVCFRVFSSGQALGGHKRSHLTHSNAATITITSSSSIAPAPAVPIPAAAAAATKYESFIDLNLPAPMEDDAELSAVSDAEFVMARSSKCA